MDPGMHEAFLVEVQWGVAKEVLLDLEVDDRTDRQYCDRFEVEFWDGARSVGVSQPIGEVSVGRVRQAGANLGQQVFELVEVAEHDPHQVGLPIELSKTAADDLLQHLGRVRRGGIGIWNVENLACVGCEFGIDDCFEHGQLGREVPVDTTRTRRVTGGTLDVRDRCSGISLRGKALLGRSQYPVRR